MSISRAQRERGYEAYALRLTGDIEAVRHPQHTDKADAAYQEAIELASTLGMRPLIAHCHLGLGKLYRRTGKREQALEHLTTAMTMYRGMGMTYWLEQAEAEIKDFAR